jgi:subtilisin family serine protease
VGARLWSCLLLATCTYHAAAAPVIDPPAGDLKRYLVFTDAGASQAVARGAKVVRETKGLRAVLCSPALAQELHFMEDIPVHIADNADNDQVQATPVQQMGLTGRGRTIVVLDTGYNYHHPELASSYLGGHDFVNDDDDPLDDNGHGSHVAGIITGDGIDARARGVAPDAGIIAGKVLDWTGSGYVSDIVAGIYWAVDGPDGYFGTADDFHADAINISIASSGYAFSSVFCDAAVPTLTDAIKYALDHGVAVVVAAGNNGVGGVGLPGCISYSLTVGAVNRSNVLASWSSTGPSVDLVAPGVGIYSSYLGSNYVSKDGTSQAAPVVSGAIALLKEAFPNASPSDLQQALFSTTLDLGFLGQDKSYGWGRVDARQALGALTASLANIGLRINRLPGQLVVSWPVLPPGFVLQSCARLDDPGGWGAVTNLVTTNGLQNIAVLPALPGNRFYRLQWR